MKFQIRSARAGEAGVLTALARAAKASHGYPDAWLTRWESDLRFTEAELARDLIDVAESDAGVIGVVGVVARPVGWWLEHLWVAPAAQGAGVGAALVNHALARAQGVRHGPVLLVADPGAAPFYERLGARPLGHEPAPMPGAPERTLPRFGFPAPGGRITQERIYLEFAPEYDALVDAEDCDGRLLPALEAIAPLGGATVLEVGVGTGRLTRHFLARGARVLGIERAPGMLARAGRRLVEAPEESRQRVLLALADARALPIAPGSVDLAVAGWVFGHFRHWMPEAWRAEIGTALAAMTRALRPGGRLVLIETLGTGREDPAPPNPALREYYSWLEAEQGFERTWVRTDYLFPDVAAACAATGFFFGDDFGARVALEGRCRVPECTGLWWRPAPGGAPDPAPGSG